MTAVISPCGQYRYHLTRGDAPRLLFVMLNPSTADAQTDDPTIRRCLGFARRLGYGGIEVANLYALRATKPAALRTHPDPVGPHANAWLMQLAANHRDILCAWGANATPDRVAAALPFLQAHRSRLWCLGRTAGGQPRHPLMLRADTELERYEG